MDENDVPVAPGVVGEMKVRGLGVTLGYSQKAAETSQAYRNGWYYPLDLCRQEISGYKVPKKVIFTDSLPMSASGKFLK